MNNCNTVCPHCYSITKTGDVGHRRSSGFYGKDDNGSIVPLSAEGTEKCPDCDKEFGWRLQCEVVCETTKVRWVKPHAK